MKIHLVNLKRRAATATDLYSSVYHVRLKWGLELAQPCAKKTIVSDASMRRKWEPVVKS